MEIIKSELEGAPLRRVEFVLPDERAKALADALDKISWCQTEVEHELQELHEALGGWR